ncbi:MAG TPA: hypothetical protein VKP64_02645, partial [Mycobacteriales bacterium]|nr:hypothetical protein [Mycobacteriales bacterium]
YPDSITFRLGIVGIVAAATGSLAGRLTTTAARLATQVRAYQQALAEVDGLRQVASATRRITSLDADTVVHEVAVAAARIGFGPVRMCRRDGDDRWTVVSADGERRDADADDEWTRTARECARAATSLVLPPHALGHALDMSPRRRCGRWWRSRRGPAPRWPRCSWPGTPTWSARTPWRPSSCSPRRPGQRSATPTATASAGSTRSG